MSAYVVPATRSKGEIRVKNSRFIASIAPAFSVESARTFIAEVREQYADATHNVPAYLIGAGPSVIEHTSDAGEPSGTAGRPALAVLKGSGLGDVVLVISRYFGGTKLGTGGLVKAYSDAARSAVDAVPRAYKVEARRVELICPYQLYEQLSRLIASHRGADVEEKFTDQVMIEFTLPAEELAGFNQGALELSNGSVAGTVIGQERVLLVPVSSRQK